MEIILNEREFAERALEDCDMGELPHETLGHLAKYYHAEGYKDREIQRLLEDFIIKCDPTANVFKWENTIAHQVKNAKKYALIELDSIPITKKEMGLCESLSQQELGQLYSGSNRQRPFVKRNVSRVLFTMICLAKYGNAINANNNNWVNRQDKEIFRMANVQISTKRQSLMLSDLRDIGVIRFSKKVDNVNINVLCLDDDGDPVMQVTDFRNLGNQYLMYHGHQYIECASCGLVVPKKNNSQRYCKHCGEERNRQKSKEKFWEKSRILPVS